MMTLSPVSLVSVVVVAAALAVVGASQPVPMQQSPPPFNAEQLEGQAAAAVERLAAQLQAKAAQGLLHPIVMLPGLTASNITYTLNNAKSQFPFCPENVPTTQMWPISADQANGSNIYCWFENMAILFDNETSTYGPRQGERAGVIDWGGFEGVSGGAYLKSMMELFGYVAGKNYFGAPFDFRYPLFANPEVFVQNLTDLVEYAYNTTGKEVVLLAPSYGPSYGLSFLHRKSQAWKDKYIAWFIAESPIWSGAPISMAEIASGLPSTPTSGDAFFYRVLSLETYSNAWLWPRAGSTNVTYSKKDVILKTPNKSYSAYNVKELLTDMGFAYKIADVTPVVNDPDFVNLRDPGVNTFVTFGYDVGTPTYFEWPMDFKKDPTYYPPPPSIYGNATETGDGVVPVRSSMRAAFLWEDVMQKAGKRLLYKGYENQYHAMCIIPSGGPCFFEVLELVNLNVTPGASSVDDAKALFAKLDKKSSQDRVGQVETAPLESLPPIHKHLQL